MRKRASVLHKCQCAAVSPFTQVLIMGIYNFSTIILSAVMEGACAGAADQEGELQTTVFYIP